MLAEVKLFRLYELASDFFARAKPGKIFSKHDSWPSTGGGEEVTSVKEFFFDFIRLSGWHRAGCMVGMKFRDTGTLSVSIHLIFSTTKYELTLLPNCELGNLTTLLLTAGKGNAAVHSPVRFRPLAVAGGGTFRKLLLLQLEWILMPAGGVHRSKCRLK